MGQGPAFRTFQASPIWMPSFDGLPEGCGKGALSSLRGRHSAGPQVAANAAALAMSSDRTLSMSNFSSAA